MDKIIRLPWQVPFGEFSLKFDPLSLIFLAAIAILTVSAGIYGAGYMKKYAGRKPLGIHALFFILLAVDLPVVVTANNIVLFLGAWEVMSIATYFLIIFHDESPSVRRAGFLYLVASHCGTFCLFLMFFLMAHAAGSMNFDIIARAHLPLSVSVTVFLLSLIGFGVKAGFFPAHIWLPRAHPAAPSHVSALLSGIAIKTGIYGIARVLWIVGALPDWCAWLLVMIGCVSGLLGVLYAIGQHEIKRLLAYHSVENIGIITIGLGAGSLGASRHDPLLAALGFGGALLHVLNHAIFKGLLFFAGGAVMQNTHTGVMDEMGGVAKKMPLVSALFMVGALSITGMPVFNGFISEFIIFSALFRGILTLPLPGMVISAFGILSLALMGALALACFAKVYGTVFLGNERSDHTAARAASHGTSIFMLLPMVFLAILCVWIGLAPGYMAGMTFAGGGYISHNVLPLVSLEPVFEPLRIVTLVVIVTLLAITALIIIRRLLLGSSRSPASDTWSCAFPHVSSKFQYTSSSVARPIIEVVKGILLYRRSGARVSGEFPAAERLTSSVHDASEESFFGPLFDRMRRISRWPGTIADAAPKQFRCKRK